MAQANVIIKLYGLLSAYGGPREFPLESETVQDVFRQLYDFGLDRNLLKGALIFVNDLPVIGPLRFRHKLECGDIIALLSPAGGG